MSKRSDGHFVLLANLKAANVANANKTVNAKKITAFKRTQILCMLDDVGGYGSKKMDQTSLL